MFARDLRLRATLLLEWQIDVLQARLRVGIIDPRLQRGVELALFTNGIEHGLAALIQLAEIAQALFQLAQLSVVQRLGGLLAIARDEWHGRSAVQQINRRRHLALGYLQFLGDALVDRRHWARLTCDWRGVLGFLGPFVQA